MLIIRIVSIISSVVVAQNCMTPNRETAQCIPIKSCKPILDAIKADKSAWHFARQSLCQIARSNEPKVCCGSTGYPREFKRSKIKNKRVHPNLKLLPDTAKCGFDSQGFRITGGQKTDIGEFPWMVLLRYKSILGDDEGFKCGGTLINDRYVLTAAHCVDGTATTKFSKVSVRLGEWDYSKKEDCVTDLYVEECADPVKDIEVEATIPHAEFMRGANDIALLRLKEVIKFTDFIRPICLPSDDDSIVRKGKYMTVSGWGFQGKGTNQSTVKLKLNIPITENTNCERRFGKLSVMQLCAGGEDKKDSCRGDSGGPLMTTHLANKTARWYQEGVVSFGVGDCGRLGVPSVYTRVSKYYKWILDNIRP